MKTNRFLLFLLTLGIPHVALMTTQAQTTTGVPGFISYQGQVLDNTGQPLGAGTPVNRTVTFRVWDHPSNTLVANLLYSEQQTVTISEGDFSVLVGQGVATDDSPFGYSETPKGPPNSIADAFNGPGRYLGVTVDDGTAVVDNEITPRQQIVTSAFAFRAKYAETLGTSANSDALSVLDSGNVGVGNTNPPARLTITGPNTTTSGSAPQLVITDSANSNERLRIGVDSTGNGQGFMQSFKEGLGVQKLLLNPNGGNVGVGSTTADVSLDVNGGVRAASGTSNNDGFTFRGPGDTDGGLFSPSDGTLVFKTNNAERMRLNSSGNLGVGTASPASGMRLDVAGNLKVSGLLRLGSGTGTSQPPSGSHNGLVIRRIDSTNSAAGQIVARTNDMVLERDGTPGGFRIKHLNAINGAVVAGLGLTHNGTPIHVYQRHYSASAATQTLFTTAQVVGHFRIAFGETYNTGHMTEVVLTRFVDVGGNDSPRWQGTITTTYNQ